MINKLRIDVARLPKYEKPFRQKAPFWLGSDGAFSLPLSRGRVLWLFGDTYVMPKTGGARREDADIINNAIGIQHGPLLARKDPFSFHCRWKGARPSAFFTSCAKKGFLWPLSAALNRGALEIFALRVIHGIRTEVFGFRLVGTELIRVSNPQDDPAKWAMRQYDLSWLAHGAFFGSNVYREGRFLYVYGFQNVRGLKTSGFVLARVDLEKAAGLHDVKHWEFLDGATGLWFRDIGRMRPIFNDANAEMSVIRLPKLGKYVMTGFTWKGGSKITLRIADTPYGPFSAARAVYDCPETKWSRNYFSYAAKAHAEMSPSGDALIMSYMTNSSQIQECFDDMRIYIPQFLRVCVKMA